MDDGPPSNLTVGERLNLLKEHQTAWNTLSWKRVQCHGIPKSRYAYHRCAGGIHAFSSDRSVTVEQLPSIIRGIPEREWTLDFPFTIDDFAFDPAQDLLVVITTEQES
jgi:hypothetical protein